MPDAPTAHAAPSAAPPRKRLRDSPFAAPKASFFPRFFTGSGPPAVRRHVTLGIAKSGRLPGPAWRFLAKLGAQSSQADRSRYGARRHHYAKLDLLDRGAAIPRDHRAAPGDRRLRLAAADPHPRDRRPEDPPAGAPLRRHPR